MNSSTTNQDTGTSGSKTRGIRRLLLASPIKTPSMAKKSEINSWRRESKDDESPKPSPVGSRKPRNLRDAHVPFFVTVMGKGCKILMNVYPNRAGDAEVQLFFNKGRYDDGLQIVRSCLKNMLSVDFDKIIAVNVYRGYYMAVQTDHTQNTVSGYRNNPRYRSNIGHLKYVDIDDIYKFAADNKAVINPKVLYYIEEVKKYIQICKEISSESL
jgi:hypothetical protein